MLVQTWNISAFCDETCVKGVVKPVDIYRRLQAQYFDETLGGSKTFEWYKHFKDGHTSENDDPSQGALELTAVIPVHIQQVEGLILDNRQTTCCKLVDEMHLSMGTVKTVIHKHLRFQKVGVPWVPRELSTF